VLSCKNKLLEKPEIKNLKKVLFIAFYLPPRSGVASLRARGAGRFLKKYGWEPIFLTPRLPGPAPEGFRVIQTRYPGTIFDVLQKIFNIQPGKNNSAVVFDAAKSNQSLVKEKFSTFIKVIKGFFDYPDHARLWIPHAISAAEKLLSNEKIDAIISTSPPVSANVIASKLKKRSGIAWVADYRDLWSQNHYLEYCRLRMWLEKRLELKTIKNADALIANTDLMNLDLQRLHSGKMIFTVNNGYDPDEFCQAEPDSDFTIRYFGSLYQGKRDPEPLFKAIKKIISKKILEPEKIKIEFYGKTENWLNQKAKAYGLDNLVEQKGFFDRIQILEQQRKSQILLQLGWANEKEKNTVPAKIYEYFAAQRPVLALGGTKNDMVEHLLRETGAGFKALNFEQTFLILEKWIKEYKLNGSIAFTGISEKIAAYSHEVMAKKMAGVLNKVT
jgi:glycosyltransferase involved in cell wall biosynthesis